MSHQSSLNYKYVGSKSSLVTAAERIVGRHRLSHPSDSAYAIARHVGLNPRTVQKIVKRFRERFGDGEAALVAYLREDPIPHKSVHFRHPNPATWIRAPPVPVSLSGEDAAAVEGFDLVPHRHLYYVHEEDLRVAVESLLASGARLTGKDDANVTLRVRDPWLLDDPAPLVERGQRLLDYEESRNIQILRELGR